MGGAEAASFVPAARASDIPVGTGKTVEVSGRRIALFNTGDGFYAVDDTCVHRGGPLGEGSLEGSVVTCPWHGWDYDVKTGLCGLNPTAKVRTYPVKREGEDILVAA